MMGGRGGGEQRGVDEERWVSAGAAELFETSCLDNFGDFGLTDGATERPRNLQPPIRMRPRAHTNLGLEITRAYTRFAVV